MSKLGYGLTKKELSMTKVERHIAELRSGVLSEELFKELRKVKLLTPAFANAKTAKNQGRGLDSYIMHLAPSKVSGYNMCPAASKGCAAACLNTAGRGRFDSIQQSRIRKTLYFAKARNTFLEHLFTELHLVCKRAKTKGLKPVVRLNGTSDLPWENLRLGILNVFELFPEIQFYDYTKALTRLEAFADKMPTNYHLTFSASEENDAACRRALELGFNVATVFKDIPATYMGAAVVNGDEHDLRFLDPTGGLIVGLKAKGDAKKDTTGFVKGV